MQPAVLLYTRSIMTATAIELTRIGLTNIASTAEVRAFALRRLEAVPAIAAFHVGGPEDWDVYVEGPDEAGLVRATLVGQARPLPLLGGLAAAFGELEGENVVLRVEVENELLPSWVEGGYDDWIAIWG